ncbi:polysaccharide deacetylase family protein [Streptomyces chromofuscus]|uniref:Polysaccharide deacetylase family protein n=1 Tax=Streptomyces chromofuscus TaxID=42881 RepID=A0A7M2T7C4_STRCW|nr:polysaccharide deacetylase family protein [Streptomyces chromofuscus]QOV44596.1 polysaccharide deacetylase family protein [Streptomyces chromofuscus]
MTHFTKKRNRLLIVLVVAVLVAGVIAVKSTFKDTLSPRAVREEAAAKAKVAPGQVDCSTEKCIALTFDGNPGEPTDRLLDLLKQYNAPSTFFLEGRRINRHPDVVRRIADEGHEIGNHTWSHPRLTDVSDQQIRDEIMRTERAISDITGKKSTLMRPPQGRTDDRVSDMMRDLGLAQILWTVTAKDYQTTDSALITERVLDGAGRDGIILLHPLHGGTVPAMPAILRELTAQGYTFVTVSQLLHPATAQPGETYR